MIGKTLYFFTRKRVGGVTTYALNLAKRLKGYNIEFHAYEQENDTNLKIPTDFFPKSTTFYSNNELTKGLKWTINEHDAIWVAGNSIELKTYTLLKKKNPLIFILHGDYDFYYNLAVKYSNIINHFICVNENIYNNLIKKIRKRRKEISVLHTTLYNDTLLKNEFIKYEKNNITPLKIIFVGRDSIEKGFFNLFKIDDILGKNNIDIEWNICVPSIKPENKALIDINKNFRLHLGYGPEYINNLYKENHIYILPSSAEGFPVSLAESMQIGVVPIVTDLDGIASVVDGSCGFLLCADDINLWAEKIKELYNNDDLYDKLSINSRELIKKNFNSEEIANKFIEITVYISKNKIKKIYPSEFKGLHIFERIYTKIKTFLKFSVLKYQSLASVNTKK